MVSGRRKRDDVRGVHVGWGLLGVLLSGSSSVLGLPAGRLGSELRERDAAVSDRWVRPRRRDGDGGGMLWGRMWSAASPLEAWQRPLISAQ